MPPLGTPLAHLTFTLNTAGVVGFFGGEEAISAIATTHVYEGRWWLGWLNSAGSYTIAKRFGRMANSHFWDGLFPGTNNSPAVSFGLDGKKGFQYIAPLSATRMQTRHIGYLTMERSKDSYLEIKEIERRVKTPLNVVYLAMMCVKPEPLVKLLLLMNALWELIPIIAKVFTCVICALVYDWFSFSMVLVDMISSGLASVVIGRGTILIKYVRKPAQETLLGYCVLVGEDELVMIKGKEDVNVITKGRFVLKLDPTLKKQGDEKNGDEKKVNLPE